MVGLISADSQQQLIDQASRQPAQQLEQTPSAAFADAWTANTRYSSALSFQGNMADAAQDSLDAFEARTGEKLANPYRLPWNPMAWDITRQGELLGTVRQRMQAKAQELGDPSLAFPDDNTLRMSGVAKARQALGAQARGAEGQQAFGTGLASAAAGLGTQFSDPVSLGLNATALAAVPGSGIALRLLGAGATFGAQALGEEALTYGYKQTVTPQYGLGDVAGNVIAQAIGGVAMEGGAMALHFALGSLWRQLVGRAPEAIPHLPPEVQDAAPAAARAAELDANNPFRTGTAGEAAHNEAIVRIESDLINDRAPTLPNAADAESGARTADVFAPAGPSAIEVIDRHAATGEHAALFDRAGRLENDITQARLALDRALTPAGGEQPFGALSQRIDDLQGQLDAITGKRRSSPRAQGLRQQIADLQARNESLTSAGETQADQQAQFLRVRLTDLQQQRAALGPEIRAAREATADKLGIPLDRAQPLDTAPSHSGRTFEKPPEPEAPPVAQPPAKKPRASKAKKQAPEPSQPLAEKPAAPAPPTPQEIESARQQASLTGGASAQAFYGKSSVRVRYELAEARDLVTSHDDAFNINPNYPPELQPRDRSSTAARDQVHQMASNLEPDRLGPSPEANAGAPIVGPDNVVESGNGRTMAVRQAYGTENAGAYRAALERQGFDTTGFREPVLVARRVSALESGERVAFAHAANGSASLRMSATEQALSDARLIDHAMGDLLKGGGIDNIANREFVRSFVDKVPAGERGGMLTKDGGLSAGGVNRIKAALVARAYGDPGVVARAFDHPEPNIKTVASSLVEAAPDWIKMRDAVVRGDIKAGQDITDDLMLAVKSIMRARDERRPVGEIMSQGDLFTSDTSQLAARLFFKDGKMDRFLSKAAMGENLTTFARNTLEHRWRDVDMFGSAPPSTEEVLRGVVGKSDRNAAVYDALRPESIEKAFDDPKMHAAAEADLGRNIEQGRNRVPVADAEGNVSLGFADKELHDLNGQLDAAKEIGACATPVTEAAE